MDTLKAVHSPNGLRPRCFLREAKHCRLKYTVRSLTVSAGNLLFQDKNLSGVFGNIDALEFIADYLPSKHFSEALN